MSGHSPSTPGFLGKRKLLTDLDGILPNADLVLALYRRTLLCGFWHWEKRWYSQTGSRAQRATQTIFNGLYVLSFLVRRRSFKAFKTTYRSHRDMDFRTNVHDWLGGYPYESIEHMDFLTGLATPGFRVERKLLRYAGRTPSGLFRSGCDEYVFRRTSNLS